MTMEFDERFMCLLYFLGIVLMHEYLTVCLRPGERKVPPIMLMLFCIFWPVLTTAAVIFEIIRRLLGREKVKPNE